MHCGKRLQALREDRCLSPRELAKRAGLISSHVRYLENSERVPGPEILQRLAKALGIDPQELQEDN